MKVPVREKIGYGCGEFGGSLIWQVIMFFLPIFYTDTFGLQVSFLAWMLPVTRLFDAVNDPLMGLIADRTNTRWGKFRPYILWLCVPYCVFGVIMFITPQLSMTGKQIYAFVTYNAMMMIYTAMMIPYSSLTGVITADHVERTSLTSYRFTGAYAGSLAVQGAMLWLVTKLGHGNDQVGYPLAMAVFGVMCLMLFLYAFTTIKERVQPPKQQKTSMKKDLWDLARNFPWLILFLVSFVTLVYVPIRSGAVMYYFKYYIGRQSMATAFLVSGTLFVMLGVTTSKWLTKKFGKRNSYIGCMTVIAVSMWLHFYLKPTDIKLLFALHWIYSFASGPTMPLVWSMYADCADYSEWKRGRRATALVFSASTFAYKAGVAVGALIMMTVLNRHGYVANQPQTETSLLGIRYCLSTIPAILAAITVLLLFFYKLDNKKLDIIQSDLQKRRALEDASAGPDETTDSNLGQSNES